MAEIILNEEERATTGRIEEATAKGLLADILYRGLMVFVVAVMFIGLNASVMWFIKEAFLHDLAAMATKPPMLPADRLVTTNVLMSLIGATVIQTGIGFIAIVSYLFPKRSS
jgi:sterol desaturase/sphingolipid hydroxylase (fatty acid hydroxylase superfamily)